MKKFVKIIRKNLVNIPGWSTKRKIIVIESDDWGSIRMPSKKTYEKLLSKNISVDKNYFDKNDSLESADDLSSLYDILTSVRDKNNKPAVITALTIVGNPDFERIETFNKKEYHFELMTTTYSKSPHTANSFELFKEGIEKRIFYPQFHGREHINVKRWMEAINSASLKEQIAFDEKCLISSKSINTGNTPAFYYQPSFDYDNLNEIPLLNDILESGLNIFKDLFGFPSVSFCAPCAIRSDSIDEVAFNNGVLFHQGGQQFIPQGNGKLKKKDRFWGDKNKFGQIYWRRNCTFEPARNHDFDWVNSCMKEIEIAFRWGKPAVINSHRVNYIGSIFPENRDKTLVQLKRLLNEIIKRWPEVEFMDSEQLGTLLINAE